MAGYKVVLRPGTRKGLVMVTGTNAGKPPTITLADGKTYTAVRGDQAGGTFKNTEGQEEWQWVFKGIDESLLYKGDFSLSYGGETSSGLKLNYGQELRTENGGLAGLDPAPNKAGGGISGGGINGGVANPYDISGLYPNPALINYNPITAAPYNFIDPMEFAKTFAPFAREEAAKNFKQAKGFALDALNTELQGMESFIPRAAALKRFETSADNIFNQQQRTQQLQQAVPDVLTDLDTQAANYRAFAQGRAPDAVTDRALELGIRSQAADLSSASGFGASSSAARKTSDLMSAKERIGLSQYGTEGLGASAVNRANLRLAPTSYSNAGQQISVIPSLSGSQLQTQQAGRLDQYTSIPATTALGSQTQQEQYRTGLEQQTRQFNASNDLQAQLFNAVANNQFALGKFGYLAGFYNNLQQTDQARENIKREDFLREEAFKRYGDASKKAQAARGRQAAASILGQIVEAFGGVSEIMKGISDLHGEDLDKDTTNNSSNNPEPIGQNSDGSYIYPEGSKNVPEPIGQNSDGSPIYPEGTSSSTPSSEPSNSDPIGQNADGSYIYANQSSPLRGYTYSDNPYDSSELLRFSQDMRG